MGWFWVEPAPPANLHHGIPPSNQSPPPSCPMHKQSKPIQPVQQTPAECPMKAAQATSSPESCPYPLPTATTTTAPPPPPQASTAASALSALNPLNYMPSFISNRPAPAQSAPLPLDRETSTIQRGDGSLWEYPSPQQMYNAMLRKGYSDTPLDAVESMVAVHNFLNEGAWGEILEWERRFGRGLAAGWEQSRKGEEGTRFTATSGGEWIEARDGMAEPQLLRFMGRPGEMTPKARMLMAAGWMFPQYFNTEPPFDRHDWIVKRTLPDGAAKEVRYVIDYYSAPPEDDGMPVFFLDVRPALDTPSALGARMIRWGGEMWWKGTGASVREDKKLQSRMESDVD